MREQLAGQVVAAYDGLLKTRPHDQALQRAAAQADREVGNMRRLLGRVAPANASYDRAIARLRGLLAEFPADGESRDDLARTLTDLGALLRTRGRLAEALTVLGEAGALARKGRAKAPDDPRPMRTEAYVLLILAAVELDAGHNDESLHASEQALRLWTTVAASPVAHPAVDPLEAIVAQSLVAAALREQGDLARSRAAFERALEAAEQRTAKYPSNSDSLEKRASVRSALGDLLQESEPARAVVLLREAVNDFSLLVRSRTRVPVFRLELAVAYRGLGSAQLSAGQPGEAATAAGKALTLFQALFKERDLPGYHYSLGRALALQARIARRQGKLDVARALFSEAIEQHELALKANPLHVLDETHRQHCRDELKQLLDGAKQSPRGPRAL
jgi:tetratricopeptide (TPR) repeat protein